MQDSQPPMNADQAKKRSLLRKPQAPSNADQVRNDISARKPETPTQTNVERGNSFLHVGASLANPQLARPATILQLQRLVGNRAVFLLIQRKLVVGAAHDSYEQEADRVAQQVMSVPSEPIQRIEEEEEEPLQAKPLAGAITHLTQRLPEEEEEPIQPQSLQHESEEEEEPLQTKRLIQRASGEEEEDGVQRVPEEDEEPLQGKLTTGDGAFAPGEDFEDRLNAQSGSGQPLPGDTRIFMENRFGADFSGVRVHTGSESTQLNRAVSAQAFTRGKDIFLGEGKYNPDTSAGKTLLAHELTHVVQQTGAGARVQRDDDDTGLKKEAAIERFSKKVKARVTGVRNRLSLGEKKEWKKLSAQERADKLLKYVNAELTNSHVPEIKSVHLIPTGILGNAAFQFDTWTIDLHSPGLGSQNLTNEQIGKLGDSIYHESRHAEQWFRMARLKAGEGLTAKQIETSMFIPAEIAQAAVERPLKPLGFFTRLIRSKSFIKRQDAKLQEAKDWYNSVYGTNAAHRNQVLGDIQNRYADYRALAEEVDAWNVGTKTNTKIKDLLKNP